MRQITTVVIALFSLLVSFQSKAFCPSPSPNGGNMYGIEDQERIAGELLEIHKQTLSTVSRLSPRDEDWLDGELNSEDGQRRRQASMSIEYSTRQVVKSLKFRIGELEAISGYIKSGDLSLQALAWSHIASSYSFGNRINQYNDLREKDLIAPPEGQAMYFKDQTAAYFDCLLVVHMIVRNLIIPLNEQMYFQSE